MLICSNLHSCLELLDCHGHCSVEDHINLQLIVGSERSDSVSKRRKRALLWVEGASNTVEVAINIEICRASVEALSKIVVRADARGAVTSSANAGRTRRRTA